ncbi:MAG: hypothetical protein ACLURV_04350 [Gallintestinimicrobium sp.]
MCGACRVTVGGEVKFTCRRTEFDGHLVSFDEAMQRQRIYKTGRQASCCKGKDASVDGQCGGEE